MVKIPKNKILQFIEDTAWTALFSAWIPGDTAARTCSLAATIPPNTKAIVIRTLRNSGSGGLNIYPYSGVVTIGHSGSVVTMNTIPISNQQIKMAAGVGTDSWDIHLAGYFVEGEVDE